MKVVRTTADVPHHLQSQNVKGQGHQTDVTENQPYRNFQGAGHIEAEALQAVQLVNSCFVCDNI